MRFGLSSFALPWTIWHDPGFTPARLLGVAREVDAAGVQICDNLPLTALSGGELRGLRALAERHDLYLEVGMRGLRPETVRTHLRVARQLGATLLRAVIDEGTYQPGLDEVGGLLRDLAGELEAGGVTLGLENHDRLRAAELRALVEAAPGRRVGVCLDTANSLGAGEGLGEVLRELGPLTVNLHVKDFSVRRLHHGLGFIVEGAPAGGGLVCWQEVLRALPAGVTCALELWTPEQPSLAESAALEREWLERSAAYLRGLEP